MPGHRGAGWRFRRQGGRCGYGAGGDGGAGVTETDAVTYELRGQVAWLTINRPESRNALGREVRDGLYEGTRRFNEDADASVMVLTGAGEKAFSAGGDLKEMAQTSLTVPAPDFIPQFGRTIEVSKPTIAAVNGVAYAGGFLLAQSCDLCVAAESARFAITEVKVGRGAPWAAPLPWLVPPRIAMQLLLTGDPIDAERAYQVGLVNEVMPMAELRSTAQRLAEQIAANAPLSVLAAKKTVRLTAERPLHDAYDEAERMWEPVYLSDDAQEGPAAFAEKRAPQWKGQ
ncbi:MAG: enoyl-CoA hydratase/isomerase family protein [Pseudonocardiaceae bacterium]|nr:enoyl-CoA hydratase/isomerase family protein [Pseudonocardiaceae bacterium]